MLEVDITKRLPEFTLSVRFAVEGEILVLFGPSGSGKTMTLHCIAGLTSPDAGIIRLGGKTLFQRDGGRPIDVPLHRRRIGYVFQDYALFPHMTVAQNLLYGVRDRKMAKARLERMLARLHLENVADRYPAQLSGGQQQRVALGRALMIEPQVLLLDEPFSALDGAIRESLQEDIARLQRELQLTMVYITHNPADAFALGDRLVVLQDGQVRQVGPIAEVFHYPSNRAVAEITGVRNLLEGEVAEQSAAQLTISWGGYRIAAPPALRKVGERVHFYIRPEDVKLLYPGRPLAPTVQHNLVRGCVRRIAPMGGMVAVHIRPEHAEAEIEARVPLRVIQELGLGEGSEVMASLLKEGVMLLPER